MGWLWWVWSGAHLLFFGDQFLVGSALFVKFVRAAVLGPDAGCRTLEGRHGANNVRRSKESGSKSAWQSQLRLHCLLGSERPGSLLSISWYSIRCPTCPIVDILRILCKW